MHHAAFQLGGKSFAMLNLEVEGLPLSFKTSPESFAELVESPGVIPAPYLARNHWVSITDWDSLPAAELKTRLRESRDVVLAKLPKRLQVKLLQEGSGI